MNIENLDRGNVIIRCELVRHVVGMVLRALRGFQGIRRITHALRVCEGRSKCRGKQVEKCKRQTMRTESGARGIQADRSYVWLSMSVFASKNGRRVDDDTIHRTSRGSRGVKEVSPACLGKADFSERLRGGAIGYDLATNKYQDAGAAFSWA